MSGRMDDVVVNDLLCFVQNKLECYPAEKLKSVIISGFSDELISVARDILFDITSKHEKRNDVNVRKKGHRQTGKATVVEMNVADIMKIFTESFRVGMSLPRFAAINLNALPRIPYENGSDTQQTSSPPVRSNVSLSDSSSGQTLQSMDLKIIEIASNLDKLASRLDSMKEVSTCSYAEVASKGTSSDAEEERPKVVDTDAAGENTSKSTGWSLVTRLKRRKIETLRGKRESLTLKLRGVETRKPHWDIYVGNLEEDITKETIQEYLLEGGVTALQVFMLKSKVRNTVSARIRVCLEDRDKVLKAEFWPMFVKVRSWVFQPRSMQNKDSRVATAEITNVD